MISSHRVAPHRQALATLGRHCCRHMSRCITVLPPHSNPWRPAPRMSEYQYYEFQAIDRPLDRAAQDALRSISSRARITATSFTNQYEWGDLKGDPRKFMERWFDLHLYLANWGTRRLMIRVPKRLVNRTDIESFLRDIDWVEVWTSGDNLIVD